MRYVVDLRHPLQPPCVAGSRNRSAAIGSVLKYRSRRRSGGNVGIPKGFPKGSGKGGKPVLRLSMLSTPRHFHPRPRTARSIHQGHDCREAPFAGLTVAANSRPKKSRRARVDRPGKLYMLMPGAGVPSDHFSTPTRNTVMGGKFRSCGYACSEKYQ